MSTQYHPPAFRSIILGIIAFLVILMFFCNLSDVAKWMGAAFLFIPDRLGIIEQVKASEIITLTLNSNTSTINFPHAGKYSIYTNDYDLLVISDDLALKKGPSWIVIRSAGSGEVVPVTFVERGLRLYDTPFAKGRPVINFEIKYPGEYNLTHTSRKVDIYFVPDYTTEREGEILIIYIIQLAVIAYILSAVVSRWKRVQDERIADVEKLKHIRQDKIDQSR
jgi:hypothetical protein